ncbi:MAG TPA: SRPBCC family protein [Acidimicrobiia bacterium]|nr:SRPBCC family protein [Acidimicrobiia bacterium]
MVTAGEARNISLSIDRDWREVYEFAHVPQNFPRWAAGLASSLREDGRDWVTDTPEGRVKVRFTPRNDFGVLDHHVTLPTGAQIFVPLRVVANGSGAEVILTLFVLPGTSEEVVSSDIESISRDLAALKSLLES